MKEENKINKIFDLLDQWRRFPAYQLERRADIFFAVYLPEIIKQRFGYKKIKILPEFPVRIGSIYPSIPINKSYKIDYLVFCEDYNKVLLVELKTDIFSRRPKQDDYLQKAKELNVPGLIGGLLAIKSATNYKKKYETYLDEVIKIGFLRRENGKLVISNKKYDIEIVYIQPIKKKEKYGIGISFSEIANMLSRENDILTKRFLKSLNRWEMNPNL